MAAISRQNLFYGNISEEPKASLFCPKYLIFVHWSVALTLLSCNSNCRNGTSTYSHVILVAWIQNVFTTVPHVFRQSTDRQLSKKDTWGLELHHTNWCPSEVTWLWLEALCVDLMYTALSNHGKRIATGTFVIHCAKTTLIKKLGTRWQRNMYTEWWFQM